MCRIGPIVVLCQNGYYQCQWVLEEEISIDFCTAKLADVKSPCVLNETWFHMPALTKNVYTFYCIHCKPEESPPGVLNTSTYLALKDAYGKQ